MRHVATQIALKRHVFFVRKMQLAFNSMFVLERCTLSAIDIDASLPIGTTSLILRLNEKVFPFRHIGEGRRIGELDGPYTLAFLVNPV
jgi:hypothetical protein